MTTSDLYEIIELLKAEIIALSEKHELDYKLVNERIDEVVKGGKDV